MLLCALRASRFLVQQMHSMIQQCIFTFLHQHHNTVTAERKNFSL